MSIVMDREERLRRLNHVGGAVQEVQANLNQAGDEYKEEFNESGDICIATAISILKDVILELETIKKGW